MLNPQSSGNYSALHAMQPVGGGEKDEVLGKEDAGTPSALSTGLLVRGSIYRLLSRVDRFFCTGVLKFKLFKSENNLNANLFNF